MKNKMIISSPIRARVTIQTAAKKTISCIEVGSVCELADKIKRFTKSGDSVLIEYLRGVIGGKMIPDSFAYKRGDDLIFPGNLTPMKIDRLRMTA